jgi:GAF domain-containing protein
VTTVQPGAEVNGNGAMGVLAVPITLRGQVIGALNLRFEGEHVASEMVSLVQEVANRLALTLENVRLLEESQRRAARERMTREVTARMRETLDIDTVLQTAIREIGEALGIAEVEVRMLGGSAAESQAKPVPIKGNGHSEGADNASRLSKEVLS